MATWVSTSWVESHIDSPEVLLLDPRRPMRYMQGHLRGAVNLPLYKAFDEKAALLQADALATWVGGAGLGDDMVPVIYDSYDGQNGAMLAWTLEYLGRTDVHLMEVFFERWVQEDREVFYRPVPTQPRKFSPRVDSSLRASRKEVRDGSGQVVIDFRTEEEYSGEQKVEDRAGRIPGAANIVWRDLLGEDGSFVAPMEKLRRSVADAGLSSGDKIVAYCQTGPRAAVGYIALKQLGYDVRLYDGSFKDWTAHGLPVETGPAANVGPADAEQRK